MEQHKVLTTDEQIKTFSDPFRMRILQCFDNFGEPATSKMVADKLGEVPSKVSYHVKKLEKADIIKLAYTKEINGIIAKYYEVTANSFSIGSDPSSKVYSQVYQNETLRVISGLYDQSKEITMNTLSKHPPKKGDQKGFFSMDTLNLTVDEMQELHKEVDAVIEKFSKNKRRKKTDTEDFLPFHIFWVGIIDLSDEK